jgi:hypothetical protein
MPDLPNWLTLILSLIFSLAIVNYNEQLQSFVSKNREVKLLKQRKNALHAYAEIKKMRENQIYMQVKLADMSWQWSFWSTLLILSAVFLATFIVAMTETETHKLINMFQTALDADKEARYKLVTHLAAYSFLLIVPYFFLLWVMVITKYKQLRDTTTRLINFDDFELKVKAQWPDAFANGGALLEGGGRPAGNDQPKKE